jgi:hypothetical protein
MGSGNPAGFDPNAFGPFGALFQNYFAALESFSPGKLPLGGDQQSAFDPQAMTSQAAAPLKAAARCQLEMFGLANRRTQAYMQVPTRLAQCRTPQDVLNEQMAFWRTAAEQYRESALKIGEAWGQAFPGFGAFTMGESRAERDYISFNGAGKDSQITTRPDTGGRQRRVA